MRALVVLALSCVALAGPVDELVLRARHAQEFQGDLPLAIELYTKALRNKALGAGAQAELHLRLARCHAELSQYEAARAHLRESLFERPEVPAVVRTAAAAARTELDRKLPRVVPRPEPPREDPELARQRRVREHLAQARRLLDDGSESQAFYHIQQALELDPADPDARALSTELETRLSGVTSFVQDPLKFLRAWTDARTTAVAATARDLLRDGLVHASAKRFNSAEAAFRHALEAIAESGFAQESDQLAALSQRIVERWREVRRESLGDDKAEPPVAAVARRTTMPAEFLNLVQRMLDVVSSPEHAYRIVPITVRPADAEAPRWHKKPDRFLLFHDQPPSRWTPARFARHYFPLRLRPKSWHEQGNYLETAGDMLVARNRPEVLDELQREVKRIEAPEGAALATRFVAVSVPAAALPRFEQEFGAFSRSDRGSSPVLFRVVPKRFSLDYLCSFLRTEGADVKLSRDTFEAELRNGAAQTFFAAQRLEAAEGYSRDQPVGADVWSRHFGLLLDAYPLRDRTGRLALGLGITARFPAPAVPRADTAATPRFLTQDAELFADLPPGSTLVVAGIDDPFAEARRERDPGRELLLLWETPGLDGGAPAEGEEDPRGVEVSLASLFQARDDPGPRADPERGFTRRERGEILAEKAAFLERLLREGLGGRDVTVDPEEAVARVPAALRDEAVALVAALQHESGRGYVVRIHTRAVLTRVFENWLRREGLSLQPFGDLFRSPPQEAEPEFLLRNLAPVERDEVFAPPREWPALTPLGLQARHSLMGRRRTSPAYSSEDDLADDSTRTVEEGLRVTVRPYTWRGALHAWVEVETAGLEQEVEERVLSRAVPSYRTRLGGTRAAGYLDLGDPTAPATVVICRLPHPTASRPQRLTEIVIALSVRPIQ